MNATDIVSRFTIGTQIIKGTNYVFEDMPYWDKEKKNSRHKRNYIGKMNGEEFIPNKNYLTRQKATVAGAVSNELVEDKQIVFAERKLAGGIYLLDKIANKLGISADLERAFGNSYSDYLSLAYYLILESDSPMYRFVHWATTHDISNNNLSSQRISELMDSIPETGRMSFFRLQANRHYENEYLAYDTTSISSYSEYIKAVRYGKNKEGDPLPQVNYALIFGEKSGLPVYYRKLPGNIADVSTVRKLLIDTSFINLKNPKFVLDRGFYSAGNITALYKKYTKFLIGAKWNTKMIQENFSTAKEQFGKIKNFDTKHMLETATVITKRQVSEKLSRNIYIHYYYDEKRASDEKLKFKKMLIETKEMAENNNSINETQQKILNKYFILKNKKYTFNQVVIDSHFENAGCFALVTNDIKSAIDAIEIYRRKDDVEKAFANSKERLEMRRTKVSSDSVLDGRFFLQFLALIFLSHIRNVMSEKNLYKKYTLQELLDEIDVIEKCTFNNKINYSEITTKQREIFDAFEFDSPSLL